MCADARVWGLGVGLLASEERIADRYWAAGAALCVQAGR